MTDRVEMTFPIKGAEVAITQDFAGRKFDESVPLEQALIQMAVGTTLSDYRVSEESKAAFWVLASWSRRATFERKATEFLKRLEQEAT